MFLDTTLVQTIVDHYDKNSELVTPTPKTTTQKSTSTIKVKVIDNGF